MSKNILVIISSFPPGVFAHKPGMFPTITAAPFSSLLFSAGYEDARRGHWKTCVADFTRTIRHTVQEVYMQIEVTTRHVYVDMASVSEQHELCPSPSPTLLHTQLSNLNEHPCSLAVREREKKTHNTQKT